MNRLIHVMEDNGTVYGALVPADHLTSDIDGYGINTTPAVWQQIEALVAEVRHLRTQLSDDASKVAKAANWLIAATNPDRVSHADWHHALTDPDLLAPMARLLRDHIHSPSATAVADVILRRDAVTGGQR